MHVYEKSLISCKVNAKVHNMSFRDTRLAWEEGTMTLWFYTTYLSRDIRIESFPLCHPKSLQVKHYE